MTSLRLQSWGDRRTRMGVAVPRRVVLGGVSTASTVDDSGLGSSKHGTRRCRRRPQNQIGSSQEAHPRRRRPICPPRSTRRPKDRTSPSVLTRLAESGPVGDVATGSVFTRRRKRVTLPPQTADRGFCWTTQRLAPGGSRTRGPSEEVRLPRAGVARRLAQRGRAQAATVTTGPSGIQEGP